MNKQNVENQATQKPKIEKGESIALIKRLLLTDGRDFAPRYAIAIAAMVVVAATTAASAWIIRDIVNEVFVNQDMSAVYLIASVIFVIFALKGIASYVQSVVLGQIGNALVARNQQRIYSHVLTLGMDFFSTHKSGELVTRLSHNAQAARVVLDTLITRFGRDLLSLIGLIIVMVAQNPFLSLITLVIAPPAIIAVSYLVKRVKGAARKEFTSLTAVVSHLQESVRGIAVIKSFTLEDRMATIMQSAVQDAQAQADKIIGIRARSSPIMETLGGFAIAAVVLYGGYDVIQKGSDPGSFFSFITALLLAYEPAKRLARMNVEISAGLVGVKLMYDLLDRNPSQQDTGTNSIAKGDGTVQFSAINFAYKTPEETEEGKEEAQETLIKDLSFTLKGGTTTALVGPSGAGKTTLFALIQRLYDPESGTITLDGVDIAGVPTQELRQNIAVVAQDTFLFDGTVFDNIAAGSSTLPNEDEVIKAARFANAHDFISALPDGYNTQIGEHGARLSGGQRQRLSIARAFIKDAPIVLLDEATSALDTQTERAIQDAFDQLMQGRTTIVIAHRLSTVLHADQICVMDKGALVEQGRHEELIKQNGLYARLHAMQFEEGEG